MAVRAPADKRFRRAHVRPARKQRWRRMLLAGLRALALIVALGYASYRAADLILAAGVLKVDRIIVEGNQRISTGEIEALVSGLRGQNILAVDLAAWQGRLSASPWVGRATLRRTLPSTIVVEVVERRPIGLGRLAGQLYLVDREGVIIGDYGPQHAEFDLPIIDGLSSEPPREDGRVDKTRAWLAARFLAAVAAQENLMERISQIDVRDVSDVVVILSGDEALIHVGQDRFVERLDSYLELAPSLRARVPQIDYVDLRFDEQVYVRPAQSGKE